MSTAIVDGIAAAILVLGTAVWLGGFVTIVVVSRVAAHTLESSVRVGFFRTLGRVFGIVSASALVMAVVGAGLLVRNRAWGATLVAATVVVAALVIATAIGVRQARAMTRLRRAALERPDDDMLASRVRAGSRRAVVLRAAIGGLTVAAVTLGVLLAR